MKIRITFTEPLLGTVSGNKEVTKEFIASKHPQGVQPDELRAIESLDEAIDKSSTCFFRDAENGKPFLFDYQIKGFFKASCEAMLGMETHTQEELKRVRLTRYLFKKTLDTMLFIQPRKIPLNIPENKALSELVLFSDGQICGQCERPLRADTMKGERIALAKSEAAPIGTIMEYKIIVLNKKLEVYLRPWLDYGVFIGQGQWRNSGCGRFIWRELTSE